MSVGENRLAGGDRQVDADGGGPVSIFETPTAFSVQIGRVQTDVGGDGRGLRQPGRRMIDVKLYAHW